MATGLEVGGDVEQALGDVGVPSYVLDTTGVVRWINAAAEQLVGDVRGRLFTSVVSPVQEFGPPPGAAGFAELLVGTSNAFAEAHGDPARLSKAHCVEASSGHYMCAYVVSRPGRAEECHLVQAHWAEEQYSSFTIVLSGRTRRCGSVREAVRSLS